MPVVQALQHYNCLQQMTDANDVWKLYTSKIYALQRKMYFPLLFIAQYKYMQHVYKYETVAGF